jgi:hypothetical protein
MSSLYSVIVTGHHTRDRGVACVPPYCQDKTAGRRWPAYFEKTITACCIDKIVCQLVELRRISRGSSSRPIIARKSYRNCSMPYDRMFAAAIAFRLRIAVTGFIP